MELVWSFCLECTGSRFWASFSILYATNELIAWFISQAGTWEEKNLSTWASSRIKELLIDLGSEFNSGKANILEVSSCVGEASVVTVRNKKRIGYSYEIALKFQGEWLIEEEMKQIQGTLNVPEASYGDLEDMQLNVTLNTDKGIPDCKRSTIIKDLMSFLSPIQDRLLQFEAELKERWLFSFLFRVVHGNWRWANPVVVL